jgi:hypothetical protein
VLISVCKCLQTLQCEGRREPPGLYVQRILRFFFRTKPGERFHHAKMETNTIRMTAKQLLFFPPRLVPIQSIGEREIIVFPKKLVERQPARHALSYQRVVGIKQVKEFGLGQSGALGL